MHKQLDRARKALASAVSTGVLVASTLAMLAADLHAAATAGVSAGAALLAGLITYWTGNRLGAAELQALAEQAAREGRP